MVVIARFLSHNIVIANSGGCWLRSFLCCKIKRFKLSNEILNLAKGWWRDSLRRRVWTYWLWSAVSQDCVALLESLPPGWAGRAGRCRWRRPSWSSRVSGWPDHRVTVSPVVAGRQVGNYWAGALLARTLGPWCGCHRPRSGNLPCLGHSAAWREGSRSWGPGNATLLYLWNRRYVVEQVLFSTLKLWLAAAVGGGGRVTKSAWLGHGALDSRHPGSLKTDVVKVKVIY